MFGCLEFVLFKQVGFKMSIVLLQAINNNNSLAPVWWSVSLSAAVFSFVEMCEVFGL